MARLCITSWPKNRRTEKTCYFKKKRTVWPCTVWENKGLTYQWFFSVIIIICKLLSLCCLIPEDKLSCALSCKMCKMNIGSSCCCCFLTKLTLCHDHIAKNITLSWLHSPKIKTTTKDKTRKKTKNIPLSASSIIGFKKCHVTKHLFQCFFKSVKCIR